MRSLTVLMLTLLMIAACTRERKIDVAASINPARMPSMTTTNVNTLISDSGVIQYKVVSPLWEIYNETDTPYWRFPEGLYLQKYDPYFQVIATVAADSAKYFTSERLWKLEGHVEMTKVPKDLFLSERIFWDQRRAQIYSDTFIHIENATHVLEGTGFVSNDRLTKYRILNPEGIFPVSNE
ncbi:MAG: LPS export ABC transporter periplasmic protein LptC [Muribaculaceae bacterium]|nr:LPS export ABC transporter periplasmic protein LptC [Muribaculaceae bacterium]